MEFFLISIKDYNLSRRFRKFYIFFVDFFRKENFFWGITNLYFYGIINSWDYCNKSFFSRWNFCKLLQDFTIEILCFFTVFSCSLPFHGIAMTSYCCGCTAKPVTRACLFLRRLFDVRKIRKLFYQLPSLPVCNWFRGSSKIKFYQKSCGFLVHNKKIISF